MGRRREKTSVLSGALCPLPSVIRECNRASKVAAESRCGVRVCLNIISTGSRSPSRSTKSTKTLQIVDFLFGDDNLSTRTVEWSRTSRGDKLASSPPSEGLLMILPRCARSSLHPSRHKTLSDKTLHDASALSLAVRYEGMTRAPHRSGVAEPSLQLHITNVVSGLSLASVESARPSWSP